MKPLERANPLAVFVYFLCSVLSVSFAMNPILLGISFAGAVLLLLLVSKRESIKVNLLFLLLFVVMALINPLFDHNGATVVFIMNNNPVTLEAAVYGGCAALMIIAVIFWMRSFARIMTADKLLCLFGTVSPKLALLFSMTVRYIPLFVQQTKKVAAAQKGMGLSEDESIPGKIRLGGRIFSIMVTWGLENGIITADSMAARGYGTGRRTFYSPFRMTSSDVVLMFLSILLFAVTIWATAAGVLDYEFYPRFVSPSPCVLSVAAYVAYGLLVFFPSIISIKDKMV